METDASDVFTCSIFADDFCIKFVDTIVDSKSGFLSVVFDNCDVLEFNDTANFEKDESVLKPDEVEITAKFESCVTLPISEFVLCVDGVKVVGRIFSLNCKFLDVPAIGLGVVNVVELSTLVWRHFESSVQLGSCMIFLISGVFL